MVKFSISFKLALFHEYEIMVYCVVKTLVYTGGLLVYRIGYTRQFNKTYHKQIQITQ